MIYVASLNVPVKRSSLKKQVQVSTNNKIIELMGIDPDVSSMDVVILGPKDVIGPKGAAMQKAINNRHPDICVIYLYEKDGESEMIDCQYKKQCKKIKESAVVDAFEEFVGQHKLRTGKQQLTSADFEPPTEEEQQEIAQRGKPVNTYQSSQTQTYEPMDMSSEDDDEFVLEEDEELVQEPQEDFNIPNIDTSVFTETEEKPLTSDSSIANPFNSDIPETNQQPAGKIEDYLAGISSYEDWSIFKEHLTKDSVIKQLINENSEYVGLVNMLDVLDRRIETVWRDSSLSAEKKFEAIKSIGLEKSTVRAASNSINVDKVISIISTIVLSAQRTVEAKLSSLDASLYKISTDKAAITDTTYIDRAIEERTKVQLELLNISRGIIDLYKSIDTLVTDEIKELDSKLPSANSFINDMVAPVNTQIFTPQNTASLANKLMRALQENRIIASQLEESVNQMIDYLFQLCDKDEEIIRYQQNMINLLKAHRVEDVIITNSLLKKSLRLFVGADNSGRSATAITWCGVLSRRQNCLLVDLTGKSKFRDYGITPMRLDDFMTSRTESPFLCVEADHIPAPDELQEIVNQLKSRLNYYPYINVIVAPEDTNGLSQLSDDALCVHYITDCSTTSINVMKEVVSNHKSTNIARKLVTIDTPVSPLMIADSLNIDPTTTRIITLPNIVAIRSCALRHDRPYEYNDVVKVFEEAFR